MIAALDRGFSLRPRFDSPKRDGWGHGKTAGLFHGFSPGGFAVNARCVLEYALCRVVV
jgi:hypothetical protein